MSSPEPQKTDHTYQSSEASEHGLLVCPCLNHYHHHHHHRPQRQHIIGTQHVHPTGALSPTPKSCQCHLGMADESESEETLPPPNMLEMEGRQQRGKYDSDDRIEVVTPNIPPALPPRPPPRPRIDNLTGMGYRLREEAYTGGGIKKYVFWCGICGGFATILGALFLAVYFLLRSYTSTLGYFETIPTYVPATMLIVTGLCVISLARKKMRYCYLIKICGLCCLVCALTCVLVTITTTVIHMNRLQTLRECVYTAKTRTCTCYSVLLESHVHADDGMRFIFDSTPDCEVIHGALYSCLRAMFGISVSGILVCIFSCMLVYQLLSHEKKKMYWEQLELRCRSFYQQQPTTIISPHVPPSAHSSMRIHHQPPPPSTASYCSCCDECRYPPPPQFYPWDQQRQPPPFWASRVGNFYSPNPGETVALPPPAEERSSWSWRRLGWGRSERGERADCGDSQYGFSGGRQEAPSSNAGSYSVLDASRPGGVYVWGPPPPYSNPASPARRPPARHHHHHHECRGQPKDNYENTSNVVLEVEQSESSIVPPPPSTRKTKKKVVEVVVVESGEEGARFLPRLQGVENAAFQKQESVNENPARRKPEMSESEVYFADVSSCCTVRNDGRDSSLYDEAITDAEAEGEDSCKTKLKSLILSKDISINSLCSGGEDEATPVTETTDDALTPCGNEDELAPDALYEKEMSSNLANRISSGFYYSGRRPVGSNISELIQNLGENAGGLLYGGGESGMELREGCSDGTMDSGWQSGEEKIDGSGKSPDGRVDGCP